jgi:hypothetical protein
MYLAQPKWTIVAWIAVGLLCAVNVSEAQVAATIVSEARTAHVRVSNPPLTPNLQDTQVRNDTQDDTVIASVATSSGGSSVFALAQATTSFQPSNPGIGGDFTGFTFQQQAFASGESGDNLQTRLSVGRFDSNTLFTLDVPTRWKVSGLAFANSAGEGQAGMLFRIFDAINFDNEFVILLSTSFLGNYFEAIDASGVLQPGTYRLITQVDAGTFFPMTVGVGDGSSTFNGNFMFIPEPSSLGLVAAAAVMLLLRHRRA